VNLAPLLNALEELELAAEGFEKAWRAHFAGDEPLDEPQMKKLNRILARSEQSLLSAEGLPRRPWFRHQVYAPGFYTGYGVKTFPGIREAIEEGDWELIDEQVNKAAAAILRLRSQVEAATEVLDESSD